VSSCSRSLFLGEFGWDTALAILLSTSAAIMADKKGKPEKGAKGQETAEKPSTNEPAEPSLKDLLSIVNSLASTVKDGFLKSEARLVGFEKRLTEQKPDTATLVNSPLLAGPLLLKTPVGDSETKDLLAPLKAAVAANTASAKKGKKANKKQRAKEAKANQAQAAETQQQSSDVKDGDKKFQQSPKKADLSFGDDDIASVVSSGFGHGFAVSPGLSVDTDWSFEQAREAGGFLKFAKLEILQNVKHARNKHEIEFLSGLLDQLAEHNALQADDAVSVTLIKRLHGLVEFDRTGNAGYLRLLSGKAASFVKPADQQGISSAVVQQQKLDKQAGQRQAQEATKPTPGKPFSPSR